MLMGSSSSSSSSGLMDSREESTIERVPEKYTMIDDIWFEIFLHLPFNSIFKFKCVSKVWISLLTDPKFIQKWIQVNTLNKSFPWTLVYTVRFPTARVPDVPIFAFAYNDNMQSSQLFSSCHSGFSEIEAKKLLLLGSSYGLVLCSVALRYYVCNPLTKKWVSLPAPPSDSAWVIHGFICEPISSSSSLSSTSCYKVVRIPDFGKSKNKLSIEIFSSHLGEWMVYEISCTQSVTWRHPLAYSRTVIHNGSLYWIESDGRVLVYDLNNNSDASCGSQCTFLNLPDQSLAVYDELFFSSTDYYRSLCLGESEGLICYVRIKRKTKTLSVWELKEEDWHLLHKDIDLHDIVEEMDIKLHENLASLEPQLLDEGHRTSSLRLIQVWCFDPFDKNVVILGYQKYIWACNICNRSFEELCNPCFQVDELMPFVLQPMPSVLPPPSWANN